MSENNTQQENSQENELETLKEQLKIEQERTKRVAADCANEIRKMQSQIDELKQFGISNFAKKIIDNLLILEIALKSVKEEDRNANKELDMLYQGLNMSLNALYKTFNESKIVKIDTKIGDDFDFNKHNAIETEDSELEPNKITSVIKEGYFIGERILSPSIVKVSKKK